MVTSNGTGTGTGTGDRGVRGARQRGDPSSVCSHHRACARAAGIMLKPRELTHRRHEKLGTHTKTKPRPGGVERSHESPGRVHVEAVEILPKYS